MLSLLEGAVRESRGLKIGPPGVPIFLLWLVSKVLRSFLEEQGFVDQLLEILKVVNYQLHSQSIMQLFRESIDILLFICYVIRA